MQRMKQLLDYEGRLRVFLIPQLSLALYELVLPGIYSTHAFKIETFRSFLQIDKEY